MSRSREGEMHVTWKDDEWEQFATLLDQAVPQANYLHSVDLGAMSLRELNDAGLKMPRPRQFGNITQSRPKLLHAFARLRNKVPGTDAPAASVAAPEREAGARWEDHEWDQFALLLHAARPDADYLHSGDLAALSIHELNEAGAKMARPRTRFNAVALSRPRLLAAYARLRDKLPNSSTSTSAGTTGTARRAPPPAEPPSPLKLDAQNRPLPAAPAARQEQKPAPDLFAPVAWDRREWLAIATEIDRMYPGSDYAHRDHLAGLTSEDIAFAQRVLPVERHNRHIKVASFSTLLPQLRQAFSDLKEQRRIEAEAAAQAVRQAQDEAERHTQQALAKASAAPAAQPEAVNPFEAAVAPLLNLVIGMLADRLRPMIAELIDQGLNAPAAPAAPPTAEANVAAQTSTLTASATASTSNRVKPTLSVGIVGNRNTYAEDLRRDFPSIEFTCIDNKREIASVKNCDRILVLTKFIGHDLENIIRRSLGQDQANRLVRVNGSLSDLRRILTGLLHIPAPAAQAQQRVSSFAH